MEHVVHGEAFAQHLLGASNLLLVGGLLGGVDDAVEVAHTEDALGHAVGMEDLEGVGLLTHGDELDGLARDLPHRERTAAAGVAVELGHDDAVEVRALGELGDDVDDVLAGHGVDHHEHLVRADGCLDVHGLLHHGLVDLETSGGVDDDDVAQRVHGLLDGAAGDVHGVRAVAAVHGHAELAAEGGELVGGRGAIDVAGREQRALALPLEQVGELGGRRGLAGALEAHEHDHVRDAVLGEYELGLRGAEELGELVEHDLDDVLGGRERVEHLARHAALLAGGHETLDDLEVDVGLEEGEADLAHGDVDVILREAPLAAELVEGVLESVGQAVEHGTPIPRPPGRDRRPGRRSAGSPRWTRPRRCAGSGAAGCG